MPSIYADIPAAIRRQQRTGRVEQSPAIPAPRPPERKIPARHLGTYTRARLLREFRQVKRLDVACANVGIHPGSHYKWLAKFPAYKARFEQENARIVDTLEGVCIQRAEAGSDQLLMFWLKARNRAVFGDQSKVDLAVKQVKTIADIPTSVLLELIPEADRAAFIAEHGEVLDLAPLQITDGSEKGD